MDIKFILLITGIAIYIMLITVTAFFRIEKEKRAARVSLVLSHIIPLPFFLMLIDTIPDIAGWIFLALILFAVVILIIPLKGKSYPQPDPERIADERDTMFSRNEIKPGTERYDTYYSMRPGNLAKDQKFRSKPGLLSKEAAFYNRFSFASADASFKTVTAFFGMRSAGSDETGPFTGVDPEIHTNNKGEISAGEPDCDDGKRVVDKDIIKDVDKDVIKDVIKDVDKDVIISSHISEQLYIQDIKVGVNSQGNHDDPRLLGRFIEMWGKKLGAVGVGFAEMKPYHFYTTGGRKERYGIEVKNDHKYGIVFTTEMDNQLTSTAPQGGIVMESAHQYLNSGMIATQVALTLRNLGYDAKTHIDGNYDLICPLVARDAGLGEIGRMGLLMTPSLGPRVRISVITTDAPLIPCTPSQDNSVIDFCTHCSKCADVCPSASIPGGDRQDHPGGLRWKIDQESCFTYWCQAGTDCGRCMAACPYSHPGNSFHNVVRWGISNNFLFRRLAVRLDDLYYGRKPSPARMPDWIG